MTGSTTGLSAGPGPGGAGARGNDVLVGVVKALRARPRHALIGLLAVGLVLRLLWLWWPQDALIFDEAFYVNSARAIAGRDIPIGSPYEGSAPGIDPNTPHPPLGKVLIAASIAGLGDGGIGWRVPSVVAAMIALLAVYGIVRASGETSWLGVTAVGLFAFDNLAFVHGRIGTLDMMSLAPTLVGGWLALRGRWALAGGAVAIGTLVKLTAVFGLAAILLLQVFALLTTLRRDGHLQARDLRPTGAMVVAFLAVAVGGLWLLDLNFTSYRDPWAHLEHMVTYGASLRYSGVPDGIASYPWQWLVNDVEINYLRVAVDTSVDGSVVSSEPTIDFRGAMNPLLIGAAPLASLFALSLWWRTRCILGIWCLTWAAANYLPYFALVLVAQRVTYLYYFLPTVPALAVAVALLLGRARLPRIVQIGYLAGVAIAFVAYFPFRQLP